MKRNIPNPKEIKKTTEAPGFRHYPSKHGNNGTTDPFDDLINQNEVAGSGKNSKRVVKSLYTNSSSASSPNLNPDEDRPE